MNTNTSPATPTHTLLSSTVADDPINISPQSETDTTPRAEWDEDEIFDGRPKAPTIEILVVPPGAAPYAHTLDNSLEAMQALIGGYITSFETGVLDTVGIAHDEGILHHLPPNRLIPAVGAIIFG